MKIHPCLFYKDIVLPLFKRIDYYTKQGWMYICPCFCFRSRTPTVYLFFCKANYIADEPVRLRLLFMLLVSFLKKNLNNFVLII